MAGNGNQKRSDALLIAHLAVGATIKDAAKATKLSQRTISRRLKSDGFRNQLAEARDAVLNHAVGRLSQATLQAVETLVKLLESKTESIQLGAARTILDQAGRLRDSVEQDTRLTALEGRLLKEN